MSLLQYIPAGETSPVEITLNEQETVLQGLLRAGFAIPNGCRAGACQSCLMKYDSGSVPSQAQQGLKATQIASGLFLSCCCVPQTPLSVSHTNTSREIFSAEVVEKDWLNEQVIGLRLKSHSPISYQSGQYMTLWKNPQTARCYSLASLPDDETLEFHIKHIPGGEISDWIAKEIDSGDTLTLQGPVGQCYYVPCDQPLLLAGIGTGLAPLCGILREALESGHQQPVSLVVGGKTRADFYLMEMLTDLTECYEQFSLSFISQSETDSCPAEAEKHLETGDIYNWIQSHHPSQNNYRVYICGAESFVKKMKKQCFLSGASMANIHADIFSPFVS